ncbi:MAG: Unknown protein [uncultured Sulfurovum sp.]|uniref:Lipoprotein n=1 Tax=uncultured Sulfurovum sp. TaxID=269237 RepID=A0A6S6TG36_9BACT|nr:MAG: Unknown protein [uncultured Sulfurovum sp.]
MKLMPFSQLLIALTLMGCAKDSTYNYSSAFSLKQNSMCIREAKEGIQQIMPSKKLFIGESLFKSTAKFRLSTQTNIESPLAEKQIIKEFTLLKENKKCYIAEIEFLQIVDKKEISCSCFNIY